MNRALLLFLIIILQTACSGIGKNFLEETDPLDLFTSELVVEPDVQVEDESLFNNPFRIVVVGDYLVVSDNFQFEGIDYNFHLLDRNSMNYIRRFSRVGKGPEEFERPAIIHSLIKDSVPVLAVHNPQNFNYSILSLDSVANGAKTSVIRQIKKTPVQSSRVYLVADTLLFGSGEFTNGRYFLADTAGEITGTFGSFPQFEALSTYPNLVLAMAMQSDIEFHSDGKRFASITRGSGNFEIGIIENGQGKILKQIHSFPPVISGFQNNEYLSAVISGDSKNGYLSLAVSDTYVFLLYSGETRRNAGLTAVNILVFDWDGNPVKRIVSKTGLRRISVDADTSMIYAIAHDEQNGSFQLVSIDLGKIF